MSGRNDPCPCGSGSKYKRCCLGKPLPNAPRCDSPHAGGVCDAPSIGCHACDIPGCEKQKRYYFCGRHGHQEAVQTLVRGHVLREHPERVPKDKMKRLVEDKAWRVYVDHEAAKSSELWGKLQAFMINEDMSMRKSSS